MPVILTGNFRFWRAKNDHFGPFYTIFTSFRTGTFSKMTGNFKILAEALYVEMVLIQESSLQLRCRSADRKSHHHWVPPLPSTKWSPWLDWCWCRCSNLWVATIKQVPPVFISFVYLVSHVYGKKKILLMHPGCWPLQVPISVWFCEFFSITECN